MDFVLDTITPDIFYQNLLLGLPKLIKKCKRIGIQKSHLTRFPPVPHQHIDMWEKIHEIFLPEDMKNFYLSTDGFLYLWSYSYGHKRLLVIGKINVNPIDNLNPVTGYKERSSPGVSLNGTTYNMRLGSGSRVFEICTAENDARVCLVYLNKKYIPTVWLCTKDMKFHFLADSFSKYFSMAVAHMGLPNWQMLYTPQGIPEWSAIVMRLICPGILNQNRRANNVEMMRSSRIMRAQLNFEAAEINVLDPNVFKNAEKGHVSLNCAKKGDDRVTLGSHSSVKKKTQKVKSKYTTNKLNSKSNTTVKPKKK